MELYYTKGHSEGIKDVDVSKGIVTGYFSAFGNKDSDGDIIQKGAYTKSINENFDRIKHLLDHDRTKAVGKLQSLKQDEFGLYYESKAGRHTQGQDFLKMAEDGIITEHSVGFQTIKEHNSKEENANIITEVRLLEGSSLQTWGSNQFTPLMGVKSEADVIALFATLEKALKNGTYSDECFKNTIIPRYKAIESILPQSSTKPQVKSEDFSHIKFY
jgi:HK97 family phage prohead protease